MRARLALSLTLLLGCGAPSVRAEPLDPFTRAARDALNARAARLGRPQLRVDAALSRAAAALAADGALRIEPGPLMIALEAAGDVGPGPAALTFSRKGHPGAPPDPEALVEALDAALTRQLKAGRFNRLGVGYAAQKRGTLTVLLLGEARIALRGLKQRLKLGEVITLEGEPLAPYSAPKLFITPPNGRPAAQPEIPGGIGEVRCEAPGRYQVEIMGEGPSGPLILANGVIHCGASGVTAQADQAIERGPTEAAAAGPYLMERINAARAEVGLKPLVAHAQAAEIARAHAEDMRARGEVAHHSPTTGGVRDRASAAGLEAYMLMENLARAEDAGAAHASLMRSPAHRAAILSSEVSAVGVGVVEGDGVLWITEVFVGEAPALDVEAQRAALKADLRGGRGVELARLSEIAEAGARRVATGRLTPRALPGWINAQIKEAALTYQRQRVLSARAQDLSALGLGKRLKAGDRWGAYAALEAGGEAFFVALVILEE
ncbi:CAP domain-containing protein [Myxococcota bacterium]|nr:CAP domain-containing protein [Myxococcota bacterium]MBU1899029.1 CAP domain-containing protein [Myxococcota bacterium]